MSSQALDQAEFIALISIRGKCWAWRDCCGNRYANCRVGNKQIGVHRLAYQLFIGRIPGKKDIHHKCGNKWCVNPSHLLCVDRKTHLTDLSPNNLVYKFKRRTHCPKGHAYSPENINFINGKYGKQRSCRICRRASFRRWWRKYGKHRS